MKDNISPSELKSMKYRKKAVVIEAIRWTGCMRSFEELKQFCPDIIDGGAVWHPYAPPQEQNTSSWPLFIHTLEGNMSAQIGDYIIKGVNGEFYPCKPNIFEKTYEAVESTPSEPLKSRLVNFLKKQEDIPAEMKEVIARRFWDMIEPSTHSTEQESPRRKA